MGNLILGVWDLSPFWISFLFQVIAYAMKEYNWPLEKARNYVRSKRRCVNPNEGFIKQLQVYEGMLDAR